MSWLEDLIQSFEQAEQDEGVPEPGDNDIAEGPSDGLYAGYNLDPARTPLSPSENTPAEGTPPSEVWPGDDYGGGGEEPDAGWNALRQQYQAARLGAGGRPASDPQNAWLEGVSWEDLPILRQLAEAHGTAAPAGSRGVSGMASASPGMWLDEVTPTDLLFMQVLASARRLAEMNASRDVQGPPAAFSRRPASFGASEPMLPLDLRRELKAFRALHPIEPAERGDGGGSASQTSSAFGGQGVQRPVMGLEQRIDPHLLEWVRWGLQQGPPPEGSSWLQQIWNSWDALVDLATGRTRPAAPTHVPPPTWTATPTLTGTPTGTRTPTPNPTATLIPRTPAPTPNSTELDTATRIIMKEVGTGENFKPADKAGWAEAIRAAAWTMRNRLEVGEEQVNDRRTPYLTNRAKDWDAVFNGYKAYTNRSSDPLPKLDADVREIVQQVFRAPAAEDMTKGSTFLLNKDDYAKIPDQTKQASYTWHFGWDPGTPTPGPYDPDPSKHSQELFTYQRWPYPTPTPTAAPTPTPTRTPTRGRTPNATKTPSR